ncbi:phosphotriesterase family protein [Chitinophaga cymbidii]|nr:phosphotriesterase [Chitinophaga cymbidii]
MKNRRIFIRTLASLALLPSFAEAASAAKPRLRIMGVNGWIPPSKLGYFLTHEHVMVDFIEAGKISKDRYNIDEVYKTALPFLTDVRKAGCATMLECTPAYLGRDVQLLQRLSKATGLHLVTNTGYYGASKEKHLPEHAYTETAEQLAARWVREFQEGIEGTAVRPGFIKLAADKAPLTPVQQKLVHAGALAHLQTGLTIGIHSGDGAAAQEELKILQEHGVSPEAFVWIHAQNETDFSIFSEMAEAGVWVEFDALKTDNHAQYLKLLRYMKDKGLLHKVLLSQDSGWYYVGDPGGGPYRPYTELFNAFIPALLRNGFTQRDVDLVLKRNPVEAFGVRVRRAD